jgi:hypothetical protein
MPWYRIAPADDDPAALRRLGAGLRAPAPVGRVCATFMD